MVWLLVHNAKKSMTVKDSDRSKNQMDIKHHAEYLFAGFKKGGDYEQGMSVKRRSRSI